MLRYFYLYLRATFMVMRSHVDERPWLVFGTSLSDRDCGVNKKHLQTMIPIRVGEIRARDETEPTAKYLGIGSKTCFGEHI